MGTVAEYLIQRFIDLGIDKAFGLPGDFPFPILDVIDQSSKIQWVGGVNELNAAYSADGYARRRGAALLCTTYGVGELSTLNALMGSKAHRVPVFLVVGAPSRRTVHQKLSTYHTLGDGVYGNHEPIMEAACCVKVILTRENAIAEIERAIRIALAKCAPAYIVVPQDVATSPIVGEITPGTHLKEIKRSLSNPKELDAAAKAIFKLMNEAARPLLLPSMIISRLRLRDKLQQFINATQIPFVLSPLSKGLLDESQSTYLGMYAGVQSTPKGLQQQVETSDLILDFGGFLNVHMNTGFWTCHIPENAHVIVSETLVQIGSQIFVDVSFFDLLDQLIAMTENWNAPKAQAIAYEILPKTGHLNNPTSSTAFYSRLQRLLKPNDTLIVDSSGCCLDMVALKLPTGVDYESQLVWSSIGFATPLAIGVAMAEPNRRVILVTGDGAHQETMGAIATMGFHDLKPIIFLLNNDCYGVEYELDTGRHHYNEIAPIQYCELPSVYGCKDWLCTKVTTIQELEDAIVMIEAEPNRGAYIQVVVPASEHVSMTGETLDYIYKVNTP